jgi:hypothetical protein
MGKGDTPCCFAILFLITAFDPRKVPPSEYEARVAELRTKRDAARKRLGKIEAELAWWEEGLRLFGLGEQEPPATTQPTLALVDSKPPLREAIVRVIKEGSAAKRWESKDVAAVLQERGWMPTGKYAMHTVRQRLRDLANDGLIHKVQRGQFAKLKEVSAATDTS